MTLPIWIVIKELPVKLLNFQILKRIKRLIDEDLGLQENYKNTIEFKLLVNLIPEQKLPKTLKVIINRSIYNLQWSNYEKHVHEIITLETKEKN